MLILAVLSYQNPDASLSQGRIRGRCSSSSRSICFTFNTYLYITHGGYIMAYYYPYNSSQVYE